MTATVVIVTVSDALTLLLSAMVTLAGAGVRWGQLSQQIRDLAAVLDKAASKEEVAQLREALAEIRGMFVLRMRE